MRTHVCIFESSQLKGSYVGDLLYYQKGTNSAGTCLLPFFLLSTEEVPVLQWGRKHAKGGRSLLRPWTLHLQTSGSLRRINSLLIKPPEWGLLWLVAEWNPDDISYLFKCVFDILYIEHIFLSALGTVLGIIQWARQIRLFPPWNVEYS